MSDKFQANPDRAKAAREKILGLGDEIKGINQRFLDGLSNAGEVLGHDEFGRTAFTQLNGQKLQFSQVLAAFGLVPEGFDEALNNQSKYVKKTQAGIVDAINEYGAYQGEGHPGRGGLTGK
ncbi:hypothetical protein [Actinoallomurus iriomotensis]|uniref:Uncharacterized protein n=1 Tax=Actinoallomurus iriomotensis TaxID=478107 RepID=A0A9W6VPU0_9ACTN|nr:hypothetical protein [Actinoallomurus iriomotensis]GLY80318.1 hypothetical protein Airi01_085850 [Actinoallomurus iriomotensis]